MSFENQLYKKTGQEQKGKHAFSTFLVGLHAISPLESRECFFAPDNSPPWIPISDQKGGYGYIQFNFTVGLRAVYLGGNIVGQ